MQLSPKRPFGERRPRGSPTLWGRTVGRGPDTPTLNRNSRTCLMRVHAARPLRVWLLLAILLVVLCLTGCASRKERRPAADRTVAAIPSPVSPVATFTPVPTPSPTFTQTPTPTPTLLPTPTPTSTPTVMRPATPTPSLTRSGAYDNLTEHPDGRYSLQLSGPRVAATFATSRSAVQHWAKAVTEPLFTVPEGFRPPYAILRTAEGMLVLANGTPDPDHPEPRRFLLRVEPDGTVHYVDDDPMEGVAHLAYSLDTIWGTTPAANDHAVLEILDAHWFRKTLLSTVPPPVQIEVPEDTHKGGTTPARKGDDFVSLNADGRVTGLGAFPNNFNNFRGFLLPELGQLHQLEHLDLGYRYEGWDRYSPRGHVEYGSMTPAEAGFLSGALPPQLGQLARLRHLDLQGHFLTGSIPSEMGRLASLEYLDLGANRLTGSLPPELSQLARLQTLNLGDNELTVLPPELGQLARLQTLNLGDNELTVLPPELGQLAHLETLYLGINRLTALPPELGQLARLQTLSLHSNRLTNSPPRYWVNWPACNT